MPCQYSYHDYLLLMLSALSIISSPLIANMIHILPVIHVMIAIICIDINIFNDLIIDILGDDICIYEDYIYIYIHKCIAYHTQWCPESRELSCQVNLLYGVVGAAK